LSGTIRFSILGEPAFTQNLHGLDVRSLFFAASWLPYKFVPAFLKKASFLANSCRVFWKKPASLQIRVRFFEISQLPCKFVSGFSKKADYLASSCHVFWEKPPSLQIRVVFFQKSQLPCKFLSYNPGTMDNDIERQKKLEADAVQDGSASVRQELRIPFGDGFQTGPQLGRNAGL
jgi:hypothetical protein